jgi:hypothetical protein
MVRGKNEGQSCSNPAKPGTLFCSKHQKEPATPAVPRLVIEEPPAEPTPSIARAIVLEDDPMDDAPCDAPMEDAPRDVPMDEPAPPEASIEVDARKRPRSPSPVRTAPPIEPVGSVQDSEAKKIKKTRKVVEKACAFRESEFEAATVMTVEEAKRLDFRIKQREYNLAHRTYSSFETERCCGYLVICGTPIVLNESRTEIMGYIENQKFVRAPNRVTDRAVIEYGLPFNADDIEVDE